MKEISDILAAWNACPNAALATVVRVDGSAYRRPGARMLIRENSQTTGSVSGGCIERDLILRAGAVRASNEAVLVRYDSVLEEEAGPGAAVGCGGTIDILIEPAEQALRPLQWLWNTPRRGAIATVIAQRGSQFKVGYRAAVDPTSEFEGGQNPWANLARLAMREGASRQLRLSDGDGWIDLFVEVIEPPPRLVIFGAGVDALPLSALGRSLGWHVTVVDLRATAAEIGRPFDADQLLRCTIADLEALKIPAGAAAVIMNHNWKHDLASLKRLLPAPLKYIGVLGPRQRTERLLAHCGRQAADALRYPVGLDIGAETPQEVALAIVAEITMVLRGGSGTPLSDKAGPIHSLAAITPAGTHEPCPIAAL